LEAKKTKYKKRLITSAAVLILIGTFFVAAVNAGEIAKANSDGLTEMEEEGILFMREEEKLARDVYLFFHEMYIDIPIFYNIAQSEQQHMDAIKNLIDRYGLEDPIAGNDIGEFTNQDLQNLYNALISQGSTLIAALEIGAEIEEIDIIDLKEYISQTDKDDIILVYNNLLKGSKNHLRAYVRDLKSRGVVYEPKHLSQDEFDDIINGGNSSRNNYQENMNGFLGLMQRILTRIQNKFNEFFGKRMLFRNRSWR